MTWGVLVIFYLFLAGLAAGAALHGAARALSGDVASRKAGAGSLALAAGLVAAGAGLLTLELERPSDVMMLIFHANGHSAISWGVRIIIAFAGCCFYCWSAVRHGDQPDRVGVVALRAAQFLAVALASYPGVVLIQADAISLWSSWLLIPLLAVSGVHAGLSLSRWLAKEEPLERRREIGFIAATLLMFLLLVLDRSDSVNLMRMDGVGFLGLIGALGIGMLAPAALIFMNGSGTLRVICVVVGCLALRAWLMIGGQTQLSAV